ncbi:hypothetical protein Esti_001477 [Eimeria stiedai]
MSTSKEAEGGPSAGAPSAGGPQRTPQGGAPPAGGGGAPGNAVLTLEDLSSAYNAGLRNNNELTQQLLLDQGWSREKIVAVFNRMNDARAGVIRRKGDNVCCVVRPANVIPALKQLDSLDYKIYCAVELAGNTGVWTADIRKSTGLQTHIIQRGVRNLCENLQLIKPVKNIQVKNRKMYILAHMEPSKEIAGGSFYTNGEFNEQLVEQLRERLSVFLCNARSSTFSALVAFVRSSGEVGGGAFSDDDILQLVATLESEDKVARIQTGSELTFVWNQSENLRLLQSVPCVGCPLLEDCSAEGRVNPSDCTYLSHWLGLDVEVEANGEEDAAA